MAHVKYGAEREKIEGGTTLVNNCSAPPLTAPGFRPVSGDVPLAVCSL